MSVEDSHTPPDKGVFTRDNWSSYERQSIFIGSLPSELGPGGKFKLLKYPPRQSPWELYGAIFFFTLAICWR